MNRAASGLSLIEIAVVMVIVSLALVPVVKMIGGPNTSEGNVSTLTGFKSRELVMANSLMERALANDYTVINCGSLPTLPSAGNSTTYDTCTSAEYNKAIYYRWTVQNLSENMPVGNELYHATLNVFESLADANGNQNPTLTLPTYLFNNVSGWSIQEQKTGMVLSLDVSGSMDYADDDLDTGTNLISSPFLMHRYDLNRMKQGFDNNDLGSDYAEFVLDRWDDSQLDLVYGQQIGKLPNGPNVQLPPDPRPDTAYNEAYPYPGTVRMHGAPYRERYGLLKMGDCDHPGNWKHDTTLKNLFIPLVFYEGSSNRERDQYRVRRDAIRAICGPKNNHADWESKINDNLSRIEAARTASLALLLNMESDQRLVDDVEMGFVTWSDPEYGEIKVQVPMETPVEIGGKLRFPNMRDRMLWINRADPGDLRNSASRPIRAAGNTRIDLGMREAVAQLMSKNYDNRIMVLLTDGDPRPAKDDNTRDALVEYAESIGRNAPTDEQITIFTVGLIAADKDLMDDIANATPNGVSFTAESVTELTRIFEQIAYQSKKIALLQKSERYGVNF